MEDNGALKRLIFIWNCENKIQSSGSYEGMPDAYNFLLQIGKDRMKYNDDS